MGRALLVASLLLPGLAHAVDGEEQSPRAWDHPAGWKVRTWALCHNRDGDDLTCAEFDTEAKDAMVGREGWYVIAIDSIAKNGGTACAGTLTIRNYSVAASGFKPILATLYIDAAAGPQFYRVMGPIRRYLDLDITNVTGCGNASGGNNLDVMLETYVQP